jgi:hypothetical protein
MFDGQNRAIDEYLGKWRKLIDSCQDSKNKEFFDRLKPTAIGWKTTDLAEFDRLFAEWRGVCDLINIALVNDRWIAILHPKDAKLSGGIEIVELMQRRPNSDDPAGLSHVDFMNMEETNVKAILAEEIGIKWTEEENGLSKWTSIWFDGAEAKLRQGTALDIAIAELHEVNNKIRGDKFAVPAGASQGGYVSDPDVE